SHWSTSKTPSYTKSVSWQHHPALYKPSPRWEHEIATALGVKPSEIWPERYDEEHEIPLRHKEAS
ncbi:helix-turn-helix domain-containing protein, partial [Escherichia coli]|uniref:helix-turn-helix domain-containing protein n=1 Tax=Escherichia coli TaxID=562 RepID=UPI003D36962F